MTTFPIESIQESIKRHLVEASFLKILASVAYYAGLNESMTDDDTYTEKLIVWAQEFSDTWIQTDNNSFELDVEAFTVKKMTRPYLVQLHKIITVRIEATSRDNALEKADNRHHAEDKELWIHADTNAKVVS